MNKFQHICKIAQNYEDDIIYLLSIEFVDAVESFTRSYKFCKKKIPDFSNLTPIQKEMLQDAFAERLRS